MVDAAIVGVLNVKASTVLQFIMVSTQHTRLDFAACIMELVEVYYSDDERTVHVLDQLNIHTPAPLYTAFPPDETKRFADRFEIHHTSKHGSWLNMAEVELSVLQRQCLRQHIPIVRRRNEKSPPGPLDAMAPHSP